jgi:hypothetical protein
MWWVDGPRLQPAWPRTICEALRIARVSQLTESQNVRRASPAWRTFAYAEAAVQLGCSFTRRRRVVLVHSAVRAGCRAGDTYC